MQSSERPSLHKVGAADSNYLVSSEMPQGTSTAAVAHGFQRDQCPVGQKLKRPSKVFLGNSRVKTPTVRLMNQVPLFQQKK